VTSVTADAANLFSRRIGCVMGQSGPQDISCRLLVGLSCVAAVLADESCLRDAVRFGCIPADFATIGGVLGVDYDPDAPSVFRFGAQNRDELPPGSVTDASVKSSLGSRSVRQVSARTTWVVDRFWSPDHIRNLEVFHHNQVVRLNESTSRLMVEVPTLIGNLTMPSRERLPRSFAIIRAAFLRGEPLLRKRKSLCRSTTPTGVADGHAVGGGNEASDPDVETNFAPSPRQRVGWHVVAREYEHPVSALTNYLDGLHPPGYRSVHRNFDFADPLEIYPFRLGEPASTVAVSRPLNAVESSRSFEPRIPRPTARFHTTKEPRKSAIESTQRSLLTRKRPHSDVVTQAPNLFQLARLSSIGYSHPTLPPCVPALLQRSVVQLPMRFHASTQRDVLSPSRAHSELVRPPHLSAPPMARRKRGSAMTARYKQPPTNVGRLGYDSRNCLLDESSSVTWRQQWT
jgi:hypothetical protein